MRLTGRFNFRRTLTGRIVLQVEEELKARWPFSRRSPVRRRWRDANVMDLAKPEMRALIDLRNKPQYVPQSYGAAESNPPTLMDEYSAGTAALPRSALVMGESRISTH